MTEISGMVCVLKMWTVLLRGGLSISKTTSGVPPLSALSSPFIPHYIKPSHAESPSGSLSPTGARKTSSSWKQLFVRYISQSQRFSGWSRTALPPHRHCRPARSPPPPSLSVLPKGSLYFEFELPKSLEISVWSHPPGPNWESFDRLRQQQRGTRTFSDGSVFARG